jgi:hypothetical protein
MDDWWVNRGFDSRQNRSFCFPQHPKRGWEATHPRTQWVQGALSSAVQMLGCEAATNVQCRGCDYVFMASCRVEQKGNFTFLTEVMKQEQSVSFKFLFK